MTVKTEPTGLVFHCDECPESIETDHNEFAPALEYIKTKGWVAYRGPDKKFAHSCPVCVAEFAKAKKE